MIKLFYLLNALAIGITILVGLPTIHSGLIVFTVGPYVLLLYLLSLARGNIAIVTAEVITVFIVLVGMYFLLDTTYMERRLEYKFSFLFKPIWQYSMILVSGLVIYFSNYKK
jgi:hypothetical protein